MATAITTITFLCVEAAGKLQGRKGLYILIFKHLIKTRRPSDLCEDAGREEQRGEQLPEL